MCALLDDIGDTLGRYNRPNIAAAILKPFVGQENCEIVEKHRIFQGYYFFHHLGMGCDLRDNFTGQVLYGRTLEFCEKYDALSFDPDCNTLPLVFFAPMVRRGMVAPRQSIYKGAATQETT